MQLGDRFGSYKAFLERFHAYKLAQGSCYGLRSCVRVRCYNRQHGTAIREDVRFIQATFGCARTQQYSQRSFQQPSLCPACIVLCYREDIDQLEITDLNSLHIHAEPVHSLPRATAVTAKPRAGGTEGGSVAGEDAVAGRLVDGAPDLVTTAALLKENTSSSVLIRVAKVMRTFLRADRGSLASLSAGSGCGLDRLSFQSSKMRSTMVPFPKWLLLHRAPGEGKHVLYAFLVEAKQQEVTVSHVSLLRSDTGCGVREMLTVFKGFNPEWRKVQTIFVDVSFPHQAVLQELFPSAQVLLPVYGTAQLLWRQVEGGRAPSSPAQDAALAMREAELSPSTAGLGALAQLVPCGVSVEPYGSLQTGGFSRHTKGGLHTGSRHRNSLDLLTHHIAGLLGQQSSLEASALLLLEHADCLDSRALGQFDGGISSTAEERWSSPWQQPAGATVEECWSSPQQQPAGAAAEPGPSAGFPAELAVLQESCSAAGWWLCLREWEVVQASSQLLSPAAGGLAVQLLEEVHRVSQDGRSCTCRFHRQYRLPCRHVLAVLQAHRGRVEEAMVCRRWQRRYQHLPIPGAAPSGLSRGSVGVREEKVRSLSLELANLLLQCEGRELEERSAMLAAVLAAWSRA
ncbi:ZSWM3 protein, partial [Bucorvus abyssinicus]|nr:ZSWM3 protein [Bucorvus abyssinicus]